MPFGRGLIFEMLECGDPPLTGAPFCQMGQNGFPPPFDRGLTCEMLESGGPPLTGGSPLLAEARRSFHHHLKGGSHIKGGKAGVPIDKGSICHLCEMDGR